MFFGRKSPIGIRIIQNICVFALLYAICLFSAKNRLFKVVLLGLPSYALCVYVSYAFLRIGFGFLSMNESVGARERLFQKVSAARTAIAGGERPTLRVWPRGRETD